MDKFLKKYFKQLHFNSMPAPVRAKFMDWLKNDALTDDMRLWVRDYMHDTPDGKKQNDLPAPDDDSALSEAEARKLFVAFQNVFAGMAADLNTFKDKDPQSRDLVNQYFGPGKLFHTAPASRDCADGITKILQLLQNYPNLQDYIVANTTKSDGKAVFESKEKLQELLTKCSNGQYDTDNSVQKKIQQVAKTLSDVVGWYSSIDQNSQEYQAIYAIKDNIANVLSDSAFATDPASIPNITLQNFRQIYLKNDKTGLLQTLYFNKTIRSRFEKYDNYKIVEAIGKAEKEVNYQDSNSENYVGPKISDKLTPLQQIEKWTKDTYADSFKKYEELRGGALFFSKNAKSVFAAIDKAGVKPVDGLDGLLKKKSDIEGKLGDPVSRQHFKWFTETMEPIAKSMPKAVAGAWKNAEQMKAVIEQIILKATDPANDDIHAMEKAKTAMEIMTAMKYGMLTSKVMDAMKQTEFNVFSDGKLSWNKNEGIQFVTKAFDKSVKAAFLGIGYSITIARNKIMMSGMEFKDKNNQKGPLATNFSAEQQRLIDKKAVDTQLTTDQNTTDQNQINADNTVLHQLNTRHNINDTTIVRKEQQVANQKAKLDAYKRNMETYKQRMTRYQSVHDEYTQNKSIVDEYNNLATDIATLTNDQNNKKNEIVAKRNEILNPNTYIDTLTGLPMGDEEKKEKEAQLTEDLKQLKTQYDEITAKLDDKITKQSDPNYFTNTVVPAQQKMNTLAAQNQIYENAEQNLANTEARYNTLQQRYNALSSKTKQFRHANEEIAELTAAINRRNTALLNWPDNNKNKIIELENYWNFLQSGDNRTWALSLKRAQQKFDKNKQQMWIDYQRDYGLAA